MPDGGLSIGYTIPGHSIWKSMPWGEAEMYSFSYTNDQVLYNQFSPYFLCRVSSLPIITNLGSLSQIRLNEYQLKCISFNYNIWYVVYEKYSITQLHKTKKVWANWLVSPLYNWFTMMALAFWFQGEGFISCDKFFPIHLNF